MMKMTYFRRERERERESSKRKFGSKFNKLKLPPLCFVMVVVQCNIISQLYLGCRSPFICKDRCNLAKTLPGTLGSFYTIDIW